jgi:hypothetical protein
MEVTQSIVVDAPVDEVWHLAAVRFGEIGQWSSYVWGSQPILEPSGIVTLSGVAGRACATDQGETREVFTAFDPDGYTFTYQVGGGPMPSFVVSATNTWTLTVVSPTRTRLSMTASMETRGLLGWWMRLPMRFGMGRVLWHNLEEFKHYLEAGTPHPRKVAARRRQPARIGAR